MAPYFAKIDQSNQAGINAEVCGNLALNTRVCTNGDYIAFGQLRHAVRGAILAALSALADHINHVVGLGSKKQMVGVNAGRVVAAMQHAKAIPDLSVLQYPGHAMGRLHASLIPKRAVMVAPANAPCPQPARIGSVNLGPEAIGAVCGVAPQRAIAVMTTVAKKENLSAYFAGAGYRLVPSHATSLGSVVRSAVGGQIPIALRYFTTKNRSFACC